MTVTAWSLSFSLSPSLGVIVDKVKKCVDQCVSFSSACVCLPTYFHSVFLSVTPAPLCFSFSAL